MESEIKINHPHTQITTLQTSHRLITNFHTQISSQDQCYVVPPCFISTLITLQCNEPTIEILLLACNRFMMHCGLHGVSEPLYAYIIMY